jgi:hypothetical protein
MTFAQVDRFGHRRSFKFDDRLEIMARDKVESVYGDSDMSRILRRISMANPFLATLERVALIPWLAARVS